MEQIKKAGYKLNPWLKAAGFGRNTFYTMSPEMRPKNVKINKSLIIFESPEDYLARRADEQAKASGKASS